MSKKYLRQPRIFSPTLRKEVVGLIESGKLSVAAASREYGVSTTSIYKWIHRYSTYNKKGAVLVVDKDCQHEKLERMQQRIAELEQAVGHKQMQIDYYEKFIDLASEEVGEDLKKVRFRSFEWFFENNKTIPWTMKQMLNRQQTTNYQQQPTSLNQKRIAFLNSSTHKPINQTHPEENHSPPIGHQSSKQALKADCRLPTAFFTPFKTFYFEF